MRHFQFSHFLLRARIQTFWITKLVLVEFPVFWLTFPGKLCNFPARHKLQNIPEFANRKLAQSYKIRSTEVFGRNITILAKL